MHTARSLRLLRLLALGAVMTSALAAPRPDPITAAARAWETGGKTRPMVDGDGALRFPYGAYQPTVVARPLHVVDVEMQPGETVQETATGDTKRWLINVIHNTPDHVIIKPTDVGLATNLVIITDKHTYNLRLISKDASYVPRVGWYYPAETVKQWSQAEANNPTVAKLPAVTAEKLNFTYWVDGPERLRPVRVFDDGAHVYLQMPATLRAGDAPAVFVTGVDGNDELVNYRLAGQYYVIDKLFEKASLVLGVGGDAQRVTIHKGEKPWYSSGGSPGEGFGR
ncbi:MAG TPA: P-type conjugative transfer protein TrbG [Candidatus Competibacteraceae bacterium]|nr:P-type conjugative transfer protein TrbG [Candidatus Competibacteraceae bacterium]